MKNPLVTIIIPNYKTLELTKLCLRSLKKYTDLNQARVIIIDNHSEDESTEYLRSLNWITLIERTPETDDTPPLSHSRALDLAFEQITTPYTLVMHTDTIVFNPQWLDFLIHEIEKNEKIAAVGSWKLEHKSPLQRFAKMLEKQIQLVWYNIINKKEHAIQGTGKNYYYLRSHCALFNTELIRKLNLSFSDENENAGKVMCKKLQDAGYSLTFIPSVTLGKYMMHINHATTVLNPALGSRKKSIDKGTKRINKALRKIHSEEILRDHSLDS